MAKETVGLFFMCLPLEGPKTQRPAHLKKIGRTAEECQWLREFHAAIWRPDVKDQRKIPWDWMPADWTADDRAYQAEQWFKMGPMEEADVKTGV